MENLLFFPNGKGGPLTAEDVQKQFFEFFRVGTHKEVLLLGELQPVLMHYIRSKKHKVLCGAAAGRCELCDLAGASADVATRSYDYCAPAATRKWKERKLHQTVVVFTASAKNQIHDLIGTDGARGKRLDVKAATKGNTRVFQIKLLDSLPQGFPSVLPPAFALEPFIRGRFGKPMVPGQEPVFFDPIEYDPGMRPAREMKPIVLAAAECAPPIADVEKIKQKLGAFKNTLAQDAAAETAVVSVVAAASPASPESAATAADTPFAGTIVVDSLPGSIGRVPLAGIPAEAYGPRTLVQGILNGIGEDAAMTQRAGSVVCQEEKQRAPVFRRNSREKGGAQ